MSKKQFSCLWDLNWQYCILDKVFTIEEVGLLCMLASFITYNDNTIRDGKTPMTLPEIAHMVGISESQVRRHMARLVKKNAVMPVTQGRRKVYVLNPELFWKGITNKTYIDAVNAFIGNINMRKGQNLQNLGAVNVNGRLISVINDRENLHI